ncbi:FecR family protein [Chromobacterium phragmitis]|uniref:FecR family protein n=1 Tax=Chromobacterium phragmitis TaxID=2202141 RepID=UPI003877CEEC
MRRDGEAANQESADAEAARWRLRRREGLDEAGRAALAAWLDASGEHRRAYAAHARVDALLAEMGPQRRERLAARGGGLLAACAGVLLACSLAWQWRATQPQWRDALASARGQLLERGLADGSRVWLDADGKAMLAYYADRREARLDRGQAMFSIARDPERPFIVEAGPLRVRVLGTRFAVRNLSGRVEVQGGGGGAGRRGTEMAADRRPACGLARWRIAAGQSGGAGFGGGVAHRATGVFQPAAGRGVGGVRALWPHRAEAGAAGAGAAAAERQFRQP